MPVLWTSVRRSALGWRLLSTAAFALVPCAISCTDLPRLDAGGCGNMLVEGTEDCEGAGGSGTACGAPRTPHECRYVCGAAAPAGTACPQGWGCGLDGVCRRQDDGRTFTLKGVAAITARILVPADFDGDRRPSLVTLSDDDSTGSRFARLLDPDGDTLDTGVPVPVPMAQPSVADLDGDGHEDVAFVDPDGVLVMQGNSSHTPVFVPYPALLSGGHPHFRGIPMEIDAASPGDELVVFADDNQAHVGLYRLDNLGKPMLDLAYTGKGEPDLAALGHANLDRSATSPCDEIYVGFAGASFVTVYSPCTGNTWTSADKAVDLKLPQPLASPDDVEQDAVVRIADVNDDGFLDVLAVTKAAPSADPVVYALLGTGSSLFAPATPWTPKWEGPPGSTGLPLTSGDIDGDGKLDFVFSEGIALARSGGLRLAVSALGSWSQAVIGDFNRNGLREVVAASTSEVNLEFISRNPVSGLFARASIPTAAVGKSLEVGDFDGDLIADVAFADVSESSASWSIAYGNLSGPPSDPVRMARFDAIDQIVVATLADARGEVDAISDLVVIPELEPDKPGETDTFVGARGRSNRTMVAPFQLTHGGGAPQIPISTAVGHLTGRGDPLRVGAVATDADGHLRLWDFLPAETASIQDLAVTDLPSGPTAFHATSFEGNTGANIRYGAHVAAGDLDGDGVDELVVSAPYADKSAIVVASRKGPALVAGGLIVVEGESTLYSLLRVADVDGDGAKDILFKPGDDGAGDVTILWNDTKANFVAASSTVLHTPEGVVDFACVRGNAACLLYALGPAKLADGTDGHTSLVTFTDRHSFSVQPAGGVDAKGAPIQLPGGDAIAVGDFDGDGLDDIAVANPAGVSIYRANANHP